MPFRLIFQNFIPGFFQALMEYWESFYFIRTHRLWKGFLNYGWLIWILLIGGLLVGYKFLKVFLGWFDRIRGGESENLFNSASMLFNSVAEEGYELFFMGGMKYIILILMEVLVFHVSRRTLEVLTGEAQDVRFNTFIQAQIRMIKVVIRSWIKEFIAMLLIGAITGILDVDFVKAPLVFLIQCYYLGFAVMDNYNERYELTIKESIKRIEPHAGAAVGIGLIFYVFLLIPLVGAIVAPVLAAVAATLLMHEYEVQGRFKLIVPEEDTPTAETESTAS